MTLNRYAHALPERDREAANILGRVFEVKRHHTQLVNRPYPYPCLHLCGAGLWRSVASSPDWHYLSTASGASSGSTGLRGGERLRFRIGWARSFTAADMNIRYGYSARGRDGTFVMVRASTCE